MHLPLHKFKYVLKVYSLHTCSESYTCTSKRSTNASKSASDIISFHFSAKKLAEELEGWLGASGLSKSSDVRGVIAP